MQNCKTGPGGAAQLFHNFSTATGSIRAILLGILHHINTSARVYNHISEFINLYEILIHDKSKRTIILFIVENSNCNKSFFNVFLMPQPNIHDTTTQSPKYMTAVTIGQLALSILHSRAAGRPTAASQCCHQKRYSPNPLLTI